MLVRSSGIFAQRLAEREMLSLGVRREPRRVRCQKGEWRSLVFAVFGQVEVHAPDQIPSGIAAFQKVLDGAFRLRQLDFKGPAQIIPESTKNCRR
jgi:hypothetical protein